MRTPAGICFVLTTLLSFALVGLAAVVFPDRVPTHFEGDGSADDWSSRAAALTFLVVYNVAITAVFLVLARWMPSMSWEWINLPDKDRWAELGRQDELRGRLRQDLLWIGASMALLDGVITLSLMEAAGSSSGDAPWWFFAAGGLWLVGVLWFAGVSMRRRYRAPVA